MTQPTLNTEQDLNVQPPQRPGYTGDVSPLLAFNWWQTGDAVLVDIRTDAERAWVGFVPGAVAIEWKIWPGMAINPNFDQLLTQAMAASPTTRKVMLLCRSGLRSVPAAERAQQLGFEAYNILEGFEGDPDSATHRNKVAGWRVRNLPWKQT